VLRPPELLEAEHYKQLKQILFCTVRKDRYDDDDDDDDSLIKELETTNNLYETNIIILLAFTTHLRVLTSSFLRFRDHTQGRTTVGRTPLEE
jgi:hypothetical protein